ncbi:MAG: glycoside hydrolase family 73 protein [Paracoccaceae bacterium]
MAQTGFLFGGNTGVKSAEELARRREIVNALLDPSMTMPQTFGEGLTVFGRAIAGKLQDKKLGREEAAERARVSGQFDALTGAAGNGDYGSVPNTGAEAYNIPDQPYDPLSPDAIAGDAMAALGKTSFTPGDKDSFIAAMMPYAIKVSEQTGLDPRIVIAQSAQETGWGKSAPGNNFFGIKSHGKGGGNTFATNEVIDGKTVRINDSFRGYESMGESVMDYARFLQENPRYKEMLAAGDLEAQIAALGRSGYATDPNYATSVRNIAMGIGLPDGATSPVSAKSEVVNPDPARISELSELASNPYLPEGQKAVVAALLEAEMGKMQPPDPMEAIELERAQLELEALKNPTADPMAAIELEQAQLNLEQDRAGSGADAAQYGTTLQFFTDADGKTRAGVLGTDGTMKEIQPPGGGDWATGIEKVDAGTKWLIYDKRTGQKIGEEVKDIRGAEAEKVIGEAEGAAAASAIGDIATADTTLGYIESLRNHPGRAAGTGGSSWTGAIPGTNSREFQVEVERLKSGAFLTAIQELRGMGALSNAEGQTATAAVAALDASGTEEGFLKRLAEYEAIVKKGRDRAAKRKTNPEGSVAASGADFSKMGLAEIGQVDIGSLTSEQMDALEARMTELGL